MSHAKQLHHRRYLNNYLEIIHREGLPGNVKTDLCLTVQDTVIATVQHVIEAALEEELHAYLWLDRYELIIIQKAPQASATVGLLTRCDNQLHSPMRRPKCHYTAGSIYTQTIVCGLGHMTV